MLLLSLRLFFLNKFYLLQGGFTSKQQPTCNKFVNSHQINQFISLWKCLWIKWSLNTICSKICVNLIFGWRGQLSGIWLHVVSWKYTDISEVVHTSETLVYFHEITWRHIPESSHLHTRCCEILKAQVLLHCSSITIMAVYCDVMHTRCFYRMMLYTTNKPLLNDKRNVSLSDTARTLLCTYAVCHRTLIVNGVSLSFQCELFELKCKWQLSSVASRFGVNSAWQMSTLSFSLLLHMIAY
jgi:hypothetical protein